MAAPASSTATPPSERDQYYKEVYNPSFLARSYDWVVLGWNMKYVWGCGTEILFPFFAENFSRNHLDVGVATGWFPATALAQPWRKDSEQRLALVDISPNSLAAAKTRVLAGTTATNVDCFEADVTQALPKALAAGKKFDTISMFNLFHCVPGGLEKLRAFGIYKELLADGGVLAGCTILGEEHATWWYNRWYVRRYNRMGAFNSLQDKAEDFERVLHMEFEEVETWVIGMMLLFRARKPRGGSEGSLI